MITILTGGQAPGLCHVLLTPYWSSSADMCPNRATHYVTYAYRVAGVTSTWSATRPPTASAHVCAEHLRQVPNIIHAKPVAS